MVAVKEVGDGAGEFQCLVISVDGELQLLDRRDIDIATRASTYLSG